MNNATYLRRRSKIIVPTVESGSMLPLTYIGAIAKNLGPLGYGLSEHLIDALRRLSLDALTDVYTALVADLRKMKGAQKIFRPMYPDFPKQVIGDGRGRALYQRRSALLSHGAVNCPKARSRSGCRCWTL
jgi:hypothetical protein